MPDPVERDLGEAERYVLPVGELPLLDEHGFLDLHPQARRHGTLTTPRRIDQIAGLRSSFVLLGAGGSGKTRALQQLEKLEGALYVNLALDRPSALREAAHKACTSAVPLCLDTVELFRSQEPEPFTHLADALDEAVAAKVPLRFACRTAAWRTQLAGLVPAADARIDEMSLLPLDRAAAQRILIREEGIEGAEFIQALLAVGRGRMAASPQRLRIAARYWHETRELPRSELTAIEYEVHAFLEESNEQRRTPLALDHARSIAQRLAAIAAFTPAKAFTTGPGNAWAYSVRELPSDAEPGYPGERVSPSDLEHVVGSALFEAVGANAVSFRHQHYAESLAAAYLHERQVSPHRILSLLGVTPDGLLPGSRASTAAWILSIDPDLAPHLVPGNAIALIQADIEIAHDSVRQALVEDIFAQVDAMLLGSQWGLDLTLVIHPQLEDQLRRRLAADPIGDIRLWWVARLATAGGCRGLAQDLAGHAGDRSRPAALRRVLVRGVAQLGAGTSIRALAAIAAGLTPEEDPDCELAGELIDRLYPSVLSVTQLLPLLCREPVTPHLFGGYLRALQRLPQRIQAEDLPVLLGWLARIPENFDQLSPTDELYTGLVKRAWQHSDDEPVLNALADLLVRADHSQRWWLHQHAGDTPPWAGNDPARRWTLTLAVADRLTEQSRYKLLELCLIDPEDVPWLLHKLPTVPSATAETIAPCLLLFASRLSPEAAALVRMLDPDHPVADLAKHLPPVRRNAPAAATPPRRAMPDSRDAERAARVDQLLDALSAALKESNRDVDSWWKVLKLLSYDEHAQVANRVPNHDMTLLPGWGLLTGAEQDRLIERGIEYVLKHVPLTETMSSTAADDVLPHLSGVHLLATLRLHFPDRLAEVTEHAWTNWAPLIVTGLESHLPDDAGMRSSLIDCMPSTARRAAAAAAVTHLDGMIADRRFVVPTALEALVPDIAVELASLLIEGRGTPPLTARLLDLLVRHKLAEGLAVCETLAQRPESDLFSQARELRARLTPRKVVNELAETRPQLSEQGEVLEELSLAALNEPGLAALAGLLLDAYPPAADPEALPVEPDQDDNLRRLRDRTLNQLIERGMPGAFTRLRVGRSASELAMLSRAARAARQSEIDLTVPDISPKALMTLLACGDYRLVRSDADLLHVVLEALDYLQHTITAQTAWRYVWDGIERPKGEDTISDWIRNQLQLYFHRFVLIDRECQVARYKEHGSGTRIDLTFTVPTAARTAELARVIVEAKRIDNKHIGTSLLGQLDQKYLVPERLSYGIYLVYWVDPAQMPGPWTRSYSSTEDLMAELEKQAQHTSPNAHVTVRILDISRSVAPGSA